MCFVGIDPVTLAMYSQCQALLVKHMTEGQEHWKKKRGTGDISRTGKLFYNGKSHLTVSHWNNVAMVWSLR